MERGMERGKEEEFQHKLLFIDTIEYINMRSLWETRDSVCVCVCVGSEAEQEGVAIHITDLWPYHLTT